MEKQIQNKESRTCTTHIKSKSKQRLFFVDALRGFAILSVVIGHLSMYCYKGDFFYPLTSFVYLYHLPLFMMIGGYFINIETFSLDKRLKLLITFFFFGLMYTFICIDGSILGFIENESKCGYWYLWTLSIYFIFIAIIKLLKIKLIPQMHNIYIYIGIIIIEIFFLFLHYLFHRTIIGTTISTDHLWRFWPFLIFGLLLKKGLFEKLNKHIISSTLTCIFIIGLCICIGLFFNLFGQYWPGGILTMFMAFPICLLFIFLFYHLEQAFKGKNFVFKSLLKKIGNDIGTNTLQIYVLHYFIISNLDLHLFGQFMNDNNMVYLEFIVSPLLAILISYICIYFSKLLHKMHLGILFGR